MYNVNFICWYIALYMDWGEGESDIVGEREIVRERVSEIVKAIGGIRRDIVWKRMIWIAEKSRENR